MLDQIGAVGNIVAIVIAVNIALSGIGKALDSVKHLTKSDVDDKAAGLLLSVTGFLGKLVDWFSANREHK